MSYISKFRYDTSYSNEDIAEALSIITGSGVAPNTPNEILSNLAEGGVTYTDGRLKVTKNGSEVSIAPGAAVMDDGSYIIVYSPEKFEVSDTEAYYIFIEEVSTGNNVPKCESALPSTNSFVLLASVKDGVLEDSRTFAKSKISGYGGSGGPVLLQANETGNLKVFTYDLSSAGFVTGILISPKISAQAYHNVVYFTADGTYADSKTASDGSLGTTKGIINRDSLNYRTVSASIEGKTLTLTFDRYDSPDSYTVYAF